MSSTKFLRQDFLFDGNKDNEHVFLIAEDNPADEVLVREMLSQAFGERYVIVCVDRFEKIAAALTSGKFEALILDMGLPDRSGVDNVTELGQRYPELPIVVLTGQDNLDLAVQALQNGAQDYLSKNLITPEILTRSLHYAKERKLIERQLRQALEDSAYRNLQLEALAKHDPLTGLPNRSYFHDAGSRALFRAKRLKKEVALLFFDLNGFKKVNDTYGHVVGDKLLKRVAERLQTMVRDSDLLVRLGGDEFVVVTDTLITREDVYPLVNRILQGFEESFAIDAYQIVSTPAIGVAFYPEADSLDLLVKHADCAMYEAKHSLEENVCFYTEKLAVQYSRTHKIELQLSRAVTNREFEAWFQPVISTQNPNALSVESLIRWTSPELGVVTPDEFISLAEHTPAINDITRQVVERSAELVEQLNLLAIPIDKIAINVCASQLDSHHFCDLFSHWLSESKLQPDKVCLELTERQVIQNVDNCKQQFKRLRKKGVRIALDDFGTGYSSLTHLLNLEMDILKLDRSVVQQIDEEPRHRALAAGVVEMAHRMDIAVIAEGIEREEESLVLGALGFDYMQGYYYARPMPLDDTVSFFVEWSKSHARVIE